MVEIIKTGFLDTIQDTGRIGFQEYGVPFSGVMDRYSAAVANAILGNDSNAAVIESVMSGPQLKFHTNTTICITGAQMNAKLNGNLIKNNTANSVQKGDLLTFGKIEYGVRVYIAISGGCLTEMVMNSRSMYRGITSKSKLEKGDRIKIKGDNLASKKSFSTVKIDKTHFYDSELEVFTGPEYDFLTPEQKDLLLNTDFKITKDSNRMAYQFEERLENSLSGMLTSLVVPGTIQLTPSGQLLALMRDCQITGGYPRVLQLTEGSINQLSQRLFGKKIRFKCIK